WGGYAMLHQVQGAYYVKGFGKHGPLHNPHTYGYFDHVPCPNFKGGHVTCGGVVYRGGMLLPEHENAYIAVNLPSNCLFWYTFQRRGSTYTCRQAGTFLEANDTWFRPVDCLVGPDGALYVADWYDKRAAHLDPIDNWDRTNGRIYKVKRKGAGYPIPKLSELKNEQLVERLASKNSWEVGEARRILRERKAVDVAPKLRKIVEDRKDQLALEA